MAFESSLDPTCHSRRASNKYGNHSKEEYHIQWENAKNGSRPASGKARLSDYGKEERKGKDVRREQLWNMYCVVTCMIGLATRTRSVWKYGFFKTTSLAWNILWEPSFEPSESLSSTTPSQIPCYFVFSINYCFVQANTDIRRQKHRHRAQCLWRRRQRRQGLNTYLCVLM